MNMICNIIVTNYNICKRIAIICEIHNRCDETNESKLK